MRDDKKRPVETALTLSQLRSQDKIAAPRLRDEKAESFERRRGVDQGSSHAVRAMMEINHRAGRSIRHSRKHQSFQGGTG
jgi:hypothetical protein